MNIEIFAMVYGYQKRYWWQLSSLIQQIPLDATEVPNIKTTADISARDKWGGWNDCLLDIFDPVPPSVTAPSDLRIPDWFQHKQHKWPADTSPERDPFAKRCHIRSRNIRRCLSDRWADWIIFVDADMVYHPQFFARLSQLLAGREDEQRVFATWRDTMSFVDGYNVVNSAAYDGPIERAYDRVLAQASIYPAANHRISGAGFFQAVSTKALRRLVDRDVGYLDYVGRDRDNNTLCDTHITRSDRGFRNRLGGIVPLVECLPQVHLNHYRKSDDNYPQDEVH